MFRIYENEKHLNKQIKDSLRATFACQVLSNKQPSKNEIAIASQIVNQETPQTQDLFYTRSVLASTGGNLNDDFFLPEELWAARATPVDKQNNIEHTDDIIGHTISQWAIDMEGNIIDDDLAVDEVPKAFHICTGGVIYKVRKTEEMQEKVDSIIESIESGEMAVSMEVLFPDFDYVSVASDGKATLIRRDKDSSFLTSHLRIYGGEGNFKGSKIYRAFRDMTFSGKGYVQEPANPSSVIFKFDDALQSVSFASNPTEKTKKSVGGVYSSESNVDLESEKKMDDTIKKELEQAKAQIEDLKNQIVNNGMESKDKEIETLKSDLAEAKHDLATANQKIKEKDEAHSCMCEELKAKNEELEKIEEQLKTESEARVLESRVSSLVSKGYDKETAKAKAEKFSGLDDEQFKEILELVQKPAKASSDDKVAPTKDDKLTSPEEKGQASEEGPSELETEEEEEEEVTQSTSEASKRNKEEKDTLQSAIASRYNDILDLDGGDE